MSKLKNIIRAWLPFAVVISSFCALAYATVQQSYRQSANDPQVQMAEDAAYSLNHDATVNGVVLSGEVEISRSLLPFLVVYSLEGKPVKGSGLLNGQLPQIPKGVLDFAKQNGENRVTWQPENGVRIASVILPFKDGFVLAGRNMREVEIREAQVGQFAGLTWILAMVSTLVIIALGEIFLRDKK